MKDFQIDFISNPGLEDSRLFMIPTLEMKIGGYLRSFYKGKNSYEYF